MYKVALFDDNKNVLDSLRCSVPWDALDCAVCGTAGNGADAHAVLLAEAPDIVISDIMMPRFSGLDLVRMGQEQGLSSKFILITGYGDLDFARQSVRLGVFDYIPKPIDNNEICRVVREAIQALRHERGDASEEENEADEIQQTLKRILAGMDSYSPVIGGIIHYVQKHFFEELSLGAIAREFSMTPSYLSTLFKRETGTGFVSFVTMVKLDHARVLLSDPRNRISEVAYKVGYKDYSYFYQVYRKYYGHAPRRTNDPAEPRPGWES